VIDQLDNLEWVSSACSHHYMPDYIRIIPRPLLYPFDPKHWEHSLVKIDEINAELPKSEKRTKELGPHYHANIKHHLILEEESLQRLR